MSTYTLVRIDPPHREAGTCYWQEVDDEDRLIGLLNDDGERVSLGNCTWTAIRDDLIPPFL